MTTSAPLIDASLAAFLQGGVSMTMSSVGHEPVPTLARATGCRISDDLRQAHVFVSSTQGAPLLACLRATGRVAVAFNQPTTHRTVQLKGRDASIGTLEDGDAALIERYRSAFAEELAPLGFQAIQVRTLLACPMEDIVRVRFTIAEAFSQTPGPKAGERLQVTR